MSYWILSCAASITISIQVYINYRNSTFGFYKTECTNLFRTFKIDNHIRVTSHFSYRRLYTNLHYFDWYTAVKSNVSPFVFVFASRWPKTWYAFWKVYLSRKVCFGLEIRLELLPKPRGFSKSWKTMSNEHEFDENLQRLRPTEEHQNGLWCTFLQKYEI